MRGMVRTVRPHQWMKNVFVLAPLVFAKELFDWELLVRGGGAFFVFCLLAGAVYTINDIVDAPADRIHPIKRHRPIAAGVVPLNVAKGLAVFLFLVAMAGALYGPPPLRCGFLYFVQNIAYSFRLKRIAYADVGASRSVSSCASSQAGSPRASPFRTFAGLHRAFGTVPRIRQTEPRARCVSIAPARSSAPHWKLHVARTRARSRSHRVASIVTYVAYTVDPSTREMFHSNWLWLTAINPIFGMLRFVHLVRMRPKAESPTQEMLRDTAVHVESLLVDLVVVVIVYKLRRARGFRRRPSLRQTRRTRNNAAGCRSPFGGCATRRLVQTAGWRGGTARGARRSDRCSPPPGNPAARSYAKRCLQAVRRTGLGAAVTIATRRRAVKRCLFSGGRSATYSLAFDAAKNAREWANARDRHGLWLAVGIALVVLHCGGDDSSDSPRDGAPGAGWKRA